MQSFVRNLSISNKDTLQDVVENCNKILNWLTPHADTALCYEDVETLIKASIYMEECIALFGGLQLIKALNLLEPARAEFYKAQADILQEKAFLRQTIGLILQTVKGALHLPAVEEMLRHVYDKESTEALIEEATKVPQQQQKRLCLVVQQLFQLPQAELDVGIERVIAHLHFELLGHALLEPESSAYYARCSILCQRIYERCTECTIPAHFIDSLHQTAAYSAAGRYFYWQCLGNACFARSWRNFCIKYFESIKQFDEVPGDFVHFDMSNICYLYCMALHTHSPCRLAYQRALKKAQIIPDILHLLQRHILIFMEN